MRAARGAEVHLGKRAELFAPRAADADLASCNLRSRAWTKGTYARRSNSVINASISAPFFTPRNTVSCCTTKPALRNRSW